MKYLLITETKLTQKMQFVLWKLLDQMGIRRTECALLPLLGDQKPKGAGHLITAAQLGEVLPAFREQLALISAEVVISIGPAPFRAITGLGKGWSILNVAGYVLTPEDCAPIPMRQKIQIGTYKTNSKSRGPDKQKDMPRFAVRKIPHDPVLPIGCKWIIPSISLDSVMKLRYKNITQFRAAFLNAMRLLDGESLIDDDYKWSDSVPPPGLDWSGMVAYDLEAQFGSTDIERASLSSAVGTWSFSWDTDAVRATREAMAGASVRAAHNQQFDIPILAVHDVEVPAPQFDTMLAASLLEPDLLKALDAVTPIYLLTRPWKHLSSIRGFADPEYSAKDAFIERQLALALQKELEKEGMDYLFNEIMMPAVPVLQDMRDKGIKLDVRATALWCADLATELGKNEKEWTERNGDVNPGSPAQLRKLLYNEWKLPVQRRKGDGVSTDARALQVLLKVAPPSRKRDIELLMAIRETGKLLNTYGQTSIGKSRVHPSYLPASKDTTDSRSGKGLAATGRLACSRPNLMNQPPEARIMYIPDHSDWCFLELDWSQAELRVAAALSGDEALAEALEGDIHGANMELLGCDRTRAKNVIFGSAYGAGPRKLKETLQAVGVEVTEAECRSLQYALAAAYPTWWSWRQTIAELSQAQQFLRNPFGRLRRFPHHNDVPAALDYLPQSIVADMSWKIYRELWDATSYSFGGRLTTVVHDSFLFQFPSENLAGAVPVLRAIMEQEFNEITPGFACPASAKVGKPGASWGELEELV